MMLVLVPLALDRLWTEKQLILRLLAGLCLGLSMFTVILTYSRGGFLAMMIVIAIMIFIFHRGQLKYFIVVALLGLLIINTMPSRFTERLSTLTELIPSSSSMESNVTNDVSFRGRTSEMIVALQMFADYPILGVGLGNYPIFYQKYSQRLGLELRSGVRQAHSLYLEVAAETGILGLLSFGLLLWVTGKSIFRARLMLMRNGLFSQSNMVTAFAIGFAGYLLAATFIHSAYPRNFWLLAGIALSIPHIAEVEIDLFEKKRGDVTSKNGKNKKPSAIS